MKLGTSVEVESTSTIQNASPVPSRHLKVNRHNLHVPDPTGSKLTINTAFGSQIIDINDEQQRRGLRMRRILSSIASSSDEHNKSQGMLNKIRGSKSLDPIPSVKNTVAALELIGQILNVPKRSARSLENCDKCGGDIQIIAIPEDKLMNNNFPNGNIVNDVGYREDVEAPLLAVPQNVTVLMRKRGGSNVDDGLGENDKPKKYAIPYNWEIEQNV